MRIKTNLDFSKSENRAYLLTVLKSCVEHPVFNFEPYETNSGDWTYWKFDSGNNWGVKFFPESPGEFEVYYRYFGDAAERLMKWLEFRIVGAEIVE